MKKIGIYILLTAVFLTSCQDWLTVQPDTQSEEDDLFSTNRGFEDALAGVYILLLNAYKIDGFMMGKDIEHLACQWETDPKSIERSLNNHEYIRTDVDTKFKDIFSAMYKTLANVNTLIKHLRKEDCILVEKDQNYYLGQALAIRAFVCFDLIRLWGPVPGHVLDGHEYLPYPEDLRVTTHPYLTYEDYMSKLMQDLDEAESRLLAFHEVEYDSPRGRFNIYGTKALKARIFLWLGETEKAAQYARDVVSSASQFENRYYLGTRRYFQEFSQPYFYCESLVGMIYYSSKTLLSDEHVVYNDLLYGLFEGQSTDVRLEQWEQKKSNNPNGEFMSLIKFVLPVDPDAEKEESRPIAFSLIRLSEMYFILMESTEDLEEANSLYKEFCDARGCEFKEFTDKQSIKDRMPLEYSREFFGEGQLFYLYKRYFVRIMPGSEKSCDIGSYVLPLPLRETNI